jgi:hypothetical protein
MPVQDGRDAGDQAQSTGESQVCAVPPLHCKTAIVQLRDASRANLGPTTERLTGLPGWIYGDGPRRAAATSVGG